MALSPMRTTATSARSLILLLAILGSCMAPTACSRTAYEPVHTAPSPDGALVARSSVLEEGTLGSSRYRVTVSKADGTQSVVAFEGENGWFSPPVWQNSSTLLVPFCFGTVSSLRSVLPLRGRSLCDTEAAAQHMYAFMWLRRLRPLSRVKSSVRQAMINVIERCAVARFLYGFCIGRPRCM